MLAIVILTRTIHTNQISDQLVTAGLLLRGVAVHPCIAVLAGRIGHLMGRQVPGDQPRHGIILATVAVDAYACAG